MHHHTPNKQYELRSKAKNRCNAPNNNSTNSNDSSSEELRQMVDEIGSKKTTPKNQRRMQA
jgi:Mg2+/Co2+ transporter CorB